MSNPALRPGQNPPPFASPMVEPVTAYGSNPSEFAEELKAAQFVVSQVWARYFAFLADNIGVPGPPGPPGPGGVVSPWFTIPYAATITPDMANGRNQRCTLTGDVTVNFPAGAVDGDWFNLVLIQDATGGRVVTLNAGYKVTGDMVVRLPNTKTTISVIYRDATNVEAVVGFTTGITV